MIANKILTTVAPPLGATVGLVRAGMAACQCGTVAGGVVAATDIVAIKCVPPQVWVSGKCVVSLGLYCYGVCTANPYAIAAGTQVLTSIVAKEKIGSIDLFI